MPLCGRGELKPQKLRPFIGADNADDASSVRISTKLIIVTMGDPNGETLSASRVATYARDCAL